VDEASAFLELAAADGDGARHLAVAASLAEARGESTAASTLLDQAAGEIESRHGATAVVSLPTRVATASRGRGFRGTHRCST
jgi:hypothetical protein